MILKLVSGISLFLAFFVAGSIILFGLFQGGARPLFPASYFLFVVTLMVLGLFALRHAFTDSGDFFFVLGAALIVCAAVTVAAVSALDYTERSYSLSGYQAGASSELTAMAASNDYAVRYVDYLKAQILAYQNSSLMLQTRIDEAIAAIKAGSPPRQVIIVQQPAPAEQQVVAPPAEHEDEEGDEYDDD